MAKKTNKTSLGGSLVLSLFALVLGAVGGMGANLYLNQVDSYEIPQKEPYSKPSSSVVGNGFSVQTIKDYEFSIHFMELGNKYTGDSSLVKAGTTEVLIDAGSKITSISSIYNYAKAYVEGPLEYIIVTHAHEDHYAGFATANYADSLFSKFNVGSGTTIIDFAQTTASKKQNTMYKNYQRNLEEAVNRGATHFTCKEALTNGNKTITLSPKATMTILETKFYNEVSSTENNHSVCTLFSNGSHHYLLTGDLEKEGELSLVEKNNLPEVDVYKAGHHGSKTSSSPELMSVIQPRTVCVCCCAGSSEYTKNEANKFPTQEFINNIAVYTDQVYITSFCDDYEKGIFSSMNGNIIVCSDRDDTRVKIYCSNNSTKLKDTAWFDEKRIRPSAWPKSN